MNSSKIYDKRDEFDFDIVNFSFLDGDVPRHAYTFRNLLDLLESAIMLRTLALCLTKVFNKRNKRFACNRFVFSYL